MKLSYAIAAAAALIAFHGPAGAAQVQDSGERLQLVDLTDDYQRVWTATQALPENERVAHFTREFGAALPGFYDFKRFEKYGATREKFEERFSKALAEYPSKQADIARVSGEFDRRFEPALASFEGQFGPMTGYPPIYLVVSQGEFDGGTRELPEVVRLLFGADMIAKLYDGKPIEPFFHHELFHLHHNRIMPECGKLWCSLWAEGLATHVARTLNPSADDESLLLTFPMPLRPAVEAHRSEAVCAVVARLDSEDSDDYAPLFMGGGEPLSENLPVRFGYYVGLLVAQDLGRTRSLQQLASLQPAEARPLVEQSLRSMADCA